MRIALVQWRAASAAPEENLRRGLDACERAARTGADLVVFPELWQTGYAPCPEDPVAARGWADLAVEDTGPWLTEFRKAAARHRIAVVSTYLRAERSGVSDAAAVIDRSGTVVSVYRKVHVCDFTWERVLTAGDTFRAVTVDTAEGPVRLGVMICFDREFPESARALALDDAELIVCPNASFLCDDRLAQIRTRAFENATAVAVANYPLPTVNGRSCVFDGRAVEHARPRDHRLALAGAHQELLVADLDLTSLRAYRARTIWGGAHRRPGVYQALIETRTAHAAISPTNGAAR